MKDTSTPTPLSNQEDENILSEEPILETQTEETSPKKPMDKRTIMLIIFAIAAFCALIWHFFFKSKKNEKEPEAKTTLKGDLVKWYGVNKRTFQKWLERFCDADILKPTKGNFDKKFTDSQVAHIKERLGDPTICQPMNKSQLKDKSESSYKTLRSNILKFSYLYGITVEDFDKISVFPPAIAQRILEQFGGEGLA